MSALISGRARPYRGRRPQRAIIALVALIGVTVVVWSTVFLRAGDINSRVSCPATATGDTGTGLSYTALNSVQPTPPNSVTVRVLNASNAVGAGSTVAAELSQWGFTIAGQPADDPLYPRGDMRCVGQIRFGPAGAGAARTVSLLVPCAELIRDDRQDDTVDLALGTDFTDLTPNSDARNVLNQLIDWWQQHSVSVGGLQAHGDLGISISPALLSGARSASC